MVERLNWKFDTGYGHNEGHPGYNHFRCEEIPTLHFIVLESPDKEGMWELFVEVDYGRDYWEGHLIPGIPKHARIDFCVKSAERIIAKLKALPEGTKLRAHVNMENLPE